MQMMQSFWNLSAAILAGVGASQRVEMEFLCDWKHKPYVHLDMSGLCIGGACAGNT